MSFPYRKRIASRRATLIPLALLALLWTTDGPARADSLYDVAKIAVDITAKDAVTARKMGMEEAEMRALQTVLNRLVPLSVQEHLPPLAREDVEGMVSGVSIRNEQSSTTRYIANLDVSFNEQAVKQFLMDQGIPFGEERAPPVSILPLSISGESVTGDDPNGWREAWEQLDLANGMTPATILRPREDLDVTTVKSVLAGDAQALAKLQTDYGYGSLVVAVGEAGSRTFTTHLAGADAVGAINVSRTDNHAGNAEQAARAAAASAFATLENRWKMQLEGTLPPPQARYEEGAASPGAPDGYEAAPRAPGEVPRNVAAMVQFSGLKDWQEIRARLDQVAGIRGLEVNALSARTASITFDYAGSLGNLQAELGQYGFAFDERDGTFVLRSR
jgi:hypothetical protein